MSSMDVIDLSSDDDNEVDVKPVVDFKPVKMEVDVSLIQPKIEKRSRSGTSVLDQEHSPVDDSENCSTSPICSAPIIRQFWKAGNYEDVLRPKSTHKLGTSYLHINPRFLHSNATSHKWAFGAIAELLDNAVDEIQNGATFVIVDKTVNPRNGSSALLIQDDGGGMDPEAMRRCLSFGFSNKNSKLAIGQYGNGFKTSSMRLGADAIVFSRHRKSTQSIGLLSYTFLTQTGHDRIVVPMVDYKFDTSTGTSSPLCLHGKESFSSNLSILLQWSPYETERDLLKQFDKIGKHGTKVIIYNLWYNEEQNTELDFESDPKDIIIKGVKKNNELVGLRKMTKAVHLADRLRYSLRAYLSVLYLRLPPTFCILLRGQVIEYHNIATELKFPEFIMYKPHSGGCVMGDVLTTIGFLKEAPSVNIHGFNVYHKNRLILPFWPVVSSSSSCARGVVGVLEANFIEPTHNKQDFEKTSVFQKLEFRLKQMTLEYWDFHCGLIGYHQLKKPKRCSNTATSEAGVGSFHPPPIPPYKPVQVPQKSETISEQGVHDKWKGYDHVAEPVTVKSVPAHQIVVPVENVLENEESLVFVKENEQLLAECLAYDTREEELNSKMNRLKKELMEAEGEYARLLSELESTEKIKNERNVP